MNLQRLLDYVGEETEDLGAQLIIKTAIKIKLPPTQLRGDSRSPKNTLAVTIVTTGSQVERVVAEVAPMRLIPAKRVTTANAVEMRPMAPKAAQPWDDWGNAQPPNPTSPRYTNPAPVITQVKRARADRS